MSAFKKAKLALHHNANAQQGDYPDMLSEILSDADCREAAGAIRNWPGYAETPLQNLDVLASTLGVSQILYKDEGPRFGLGSFKALGGAYAVMHLLKQELSKKLGRDVSLTEIANGDHKDLAAEITVITATDGNHGRSVAWGAEQFGCPCRIYMHEAVSQGRADAVEAFGAKVVWVKGNYDQSVRAAADDAQANGWFIVSDTSYEGYMDLPRKVMAGYTVMTSEIVDQLAGAPAPTHVFVQGGVGGLAGAVCSHFWQIWGENRPRFIIAEPDRAPCLYESARQGRPTAVDIEEETMMAGLSCGEVSLLGWEVLSRGTDDFLTLQDDLVAPVMRDLANGCYGPKIVAGESAVAGLAALMACKAAPDMAMRLGLDQNSRILLIGTEGATDPEIYKSIVGLSAEQVAA